MALISLGLISKKIRLAKHEYMNIPLPPINASALYRLYTATLFASWRVDFMQGNQFPRLTYLRASSQKS